MVEVLQAVQVVQVPVDRGMLAVDLERVERLVAAGVAGRFEQPERAVVEVAEERAGVVDADRSRLLPVSSVCFRSLTNVSVIAVTSLDAAVEPDGRVDAVGQQVAGHAAAGRRRVEPPQPLPRLAAGRR